MNAETLHSLVLALREEFTSTNVRGIMSELMTALTNQVNAPQEATYQQQVSTLRTQLRGVLEDAPSNAFPPVWKEHLRDLAIDELVGAALLDRVESIFLGNQITAATAREEITGLSNRLDQQLGAALE